MSNPAPHPEAAGEQPVDELVVVVHGVGDPQPGETLSLFARSIAESRHPLTEHQEVLWLADQTGDLRERDVGTFPCHIRHLAFGTNRSTLAELYWGDLSRVKRGILGVVQGMVSIVFGLRYVAFVASEQPGWAARMLQILGLICSRLLHGPVLAVDFVLALLMASVFATEALWPGSSQVVHWANLLILGCGSFCLLASFLGWRMSRNSVTHRFWFWVMVTAVMVAVLMIFNLVFNRPLPLVAYCNVIVTMLGAQWVTLVITLLLMMFFWAVALLQKCNYRPALHVALILPAVAVGFWGQVIPMMWVGASSFLAGGGADNLLVAGYSRVIEPEIGMSQPAVAGPASGPVPVAGFRGQLALMFDRAVPLLGIQFVMTLSLGLLLICQLARYVKWAEKTTVERFNHGHRGPRLIVNELLQFAVLACAVIGIVLVLYICFHEMQGHHHRDDWICVLLIEANKYAVGFLVPIAGVLVLSLQYLRPALDIVLDVVNHFYFRSATSADLRNGVGEDFDLDEVTFNGGEYYFSRRDAIHRRLKRILEYHRHTMQGKPALTIVSHSQGSMVAIEVLNDEELDWIRDRFDQINLVTMGSPFGHIYQQYFAHFYPPLDAPEWERLNRRLDRWLNIFRIDDFVGTRIEYPAAEMEGRFTNHAVQRKGHMFYWRDRQVLEVIQGNGICQSLVPSVMDHPSRSAA